MFIRQPCVFSFEDALKMQPMSRLEMVMSTLDLKPILSMIPEYRTGPKGYSFEAKLRALLAARIERIIGMATGNSCTISVPLRNGASADKRSI